MNPAEQIVPEAEAEASGYGLEAALQRPLEVDKNLTMMVQEIRMEMPNNLKQEGEKLMQEKSYCNGPRFLTLCSVARSRWSLSRSRKRKVVQQWETIFPVKDSRLNKKHKREDRILAKQHIIYYHILHSTANTIM